MSAGLFELTCPDCGGKLALDEAGTGSCLGCGRTYLTRFGHLIPVDDDRRPDNVPAR